MNRAAAQRPPTPLHLPARVAPWCAAAVLALAGCNATMPQAPDRAPPAAAPAPAGSPFASALRCMDTLLQEHGVRDISVLVEDLADANARPVASGGKEMLQSIVAEMTPRSRAIRLVGSSAEWSQTLNLVAQSGKREPAALAPQFALRGALRTVDASGGATTVGLDLSLLNTQDLSLVPGTATRNVIALRARAGATEQQGELRKFGQRFGFSAEGAAAAARPLVELSAIELFGRLAHVPYWSCLGAADGEASVSGEIQDWYDTLASRPTELVRYFQHQLRLRRVYDGPIDGTVNAALRDGVVRYRELLGLSREAKLTLNFFRAYLAADHGSIAGRIPAPAATLAATPAPAKADAPAALAAAPAPAPDAPATRLALRIAALNDTQRFARGEAVQLSITPNRDAHVYCFLQDEKRRITRFFPNRFQRDSRVEPSPGLQLPGQQRFEIAMNPRGATETVACFATERDVLAELPPGVADGDFAPLPVASLDQVRLAFVRASAGTLAHDSFELRLR
jgi:hypothetical protein